MLIKAVSEGRSVEVVCAETAGENTLPLGRLEIAIDIYDEPYYGKKVCKSGGSIASHAMDCDCGGCRVIRDAANDNHVDSTSTPTDNYQPPIVTFAPENQN